MLRKSKRICIICMLLSIGTIFPKFVNAYYDNDDEDKDYYKSNGTTYKRSGNVVISNTGKHYTISGNEAYGSDGSHYTITGNTIKDNDSDKVCTVTSSGQIDCH
ncbi:MAG: hypothetical protein NC218_04310 [Acetobacter sp.]|nr:hypothetical protein [Acetobacter sp.]